MLDISVKQMKYAVEIGRCGSINQAAQKLYVSQSSLSKAMKELESILGYAVFQRSPGGTVVTAEGKEFLKVAEEIVYKLEVLEQHELVQLPCPDNRHRYSDILIYREDYPLASHMEQFYSVLLQTKNEIEKSL